MDVPYYTYEVERARHTNISVSLVNNAWISCSRCWERGPLDRVRGKTASCRSLV